VTNKHGVHVPALWRDAMPSLVAIHSASSSAVNGSVAGGIACAVDGIFKYPFASFTITSWNFLKSRHSVPEEEEAPVPPPSDGKGCASRMIFWALVQESKLTLLDVSLVQLDIGEDN